LGSDSKFSLRLILEAEVYPTEDEKKVIQAMKTIVPFSVIKDGYDPLSKLRNSFRSNRILDTARSLLISKKGDIRPLRFHKQAAIVGRVSLVDNEEFSPLGVIVLRIYYDGDPLILADWLTPRTEGGKPVNEATLQDLLYGRS
jgi:predicted RNA binding protein with dsRBD fold (UPF0201 family)